MADFLDIAKKTMMTGIGFALKTKDEVEDWAREFATKGELSENEGEKFVDELTKRYEEAREGFETRLEKAIKDVMQKLKIPTADDLKNLKNDIAELKNKTDNKSDDNDQGDE